MMNTKTICRKCKGEILDGQLVLDASLDGCAGEHTADDCRRGQLRDDWATRLTAGAVAS